MFAKSVVAAAFLPLAVLAQEPPFMGAGSWEIAAPRNNRFTLNLQLDSVAPQGVTGTITGNVFWKCQETLPITGSSVEPDRITVRSINAEDERVRPHDHLHRRRRQDHRDDRQRKRSQPHEGQEATVELVARERSRHHPTVSAVGRVGWSG